MLESPKAGKQQKQPLKQQRCELSTVESTRDDSGRGLRAVRGSPLCVLLGRDAQHDVDRRALVEI